MTITSNVAALDAEFRRAEQRLALVRDLIANPDDHAIHAKLLAKLEEDGIRLPGSPERAIWNIYEHASMHHRNVDCAHFLIVDPTLGVKCSRLAFVCGRFDCVVLEFANLSNMQSYHSACQWGAAAIRDRLSWEPPFTGAPRWEVHTHSIYHAREIMRLDALAREYLLDAIVTTALWEVISLEDAFQIAAERVDHGFSQHELASVVAEITRLSATDHRGAFGPIPDERMIAQFNRESHDQHDQSARRAIDSIRKFQIERAGTRVEEALKVVADANRRLDAVA